MMQKILVATDLSRRADDAMRRAARLAREFGAELIVLHVIEEDQPDRIVAAGKRHAAELLDEQARTLTDELQGAPIQILVETGDVFKAILDVADASAVDLIVMGRHRRKLLRDLLTGTTIERVMRLGSRPVLMVNRTPAHSYRYVLAAVDLSENSGLAIRAAKELGLLREASIKVLHAYRAIAKAKMIHAGVSEEQVQEHVAECAREAMAQLNEFVARLGLEGTTLGRSVEEGEPTRVIKQVVDREQPDLLLVGTHGHTGLTKLLLGSVVDTLLREVSCDVLAVPPPRSA